MGWDWAWACTWRWSVVGAENGYSGQAVVAKSPCGWLAACDFTVVPAGRRSPWLTAYPVWEADG